MLLHIPGVHHSVPLMCTWVWFTRSLNHVSSPVVITSILAQSVLWYISREVRGIKFVPTYTTFGGSSAGTPGARAPVWIFFFSRFYFRKFRQHNTHKLYCNQHAMFTMCILFSTITNKAKAMCEGASEPSPDLKNYTCTAPGPRPPVLKFLDPPLVHHFSAKGNLKLNFPQSSSVWPQGNFK